MKKLVVLISNVGKGSNLAAIISEIKSKKLKMKLVAVVSDTSDAAGLVHAKKNKIPIKICPKKTKLLSILSKLRPDYVVLAGWKQYVEDAVIDSFPNRILNLHPGLIPDSMNSIVTAPDKTKALWNKGMLADKAVGNFLNKRSTYAGSSVHFLTHEFDFGPVLVRGFEKIKKGDTVESLYSRLKEVEHEILNQALKIIAEKKYRVLVIDAGGRGSALCDKYLKSSKVLQVLAIPGNDFMKYEQSVKTYQDVKITDVSRIKSIAKKERVDLVDVAQDYAVAAGLVDTFKKSNIKVIGPTKAAGQIEWDKSWSRNFMKKFNLPIPNYKVCNSEEEGVNFIRSQKESEWFVKASGLAAGKGAIYAKSNKDAISSIRLMRSFGKAGEIYLLEECLVGEEFSAFALVSGNKFQVLGFAQDHKRVFDGDRGPNTGGMGCSAPPKVVSRKVEKQVISIFKKTVNGLIAMKRPYSGILYLGSIVDKEGNVKIIEFNARWGDPEAQVLLPGIKTDYFDLMMNLLQGKEITIKKDGKYRVVIAVAARGYPEDYSKVLGKKIDGFSEELENIKLFGAGIKRAGDTWTIAGGRLFYLVGSGKNVAQAREMAYNALSKIIIGRGNLHYRKDIGYRDLNRSRHGSS